jgi:hypothetical protein
MATARQRGKPDLGRLPGRDKVPVLRALHKDPDRRFGSNLEFIEALKSKPASPAVTPSSRLVPLLPAPGKVLLAQPTGLVRPPAVPTGLVGPPPTAPGTAALRRLVSDCVAAATGGSELGEGRGLRYLLRPDGVLEHRCGALLPPGTAPVKLEAFRDYWKAQKLADDGSACSFFLQRSGSLWQRCLGRAPGLEVHLRLRSPRMTQSWLTEVRIEIRPTGCGPDQAAELLRTTGPLVLESLHHFLQVVPDRRRHPRWPLDRTVQVFPMLEGNQLGEAIVAQCQDISEGGVGLFLPCQPPSSEVLLQFPEAGATVRAHAVGTHPGPDGRYAVGLRFDLEK